MQAHKQGPQEPQGEPKRSKLMRQTTPTNAKFGN